jgi:hypothetical protein
MAGTFFCLGEMLESTPSIKGSSGGKGAVKTLPAGVTHKDSHFAQRLSRKRDKIMSVITIGPLVFIKFPMAGVGLSGGSAQGPFGILLENCRGFE